ncbi:MAG: hypothetical protein QGF74_00770 [Candidatus Nanoarchaeia archaeon]|jgi:hypothetical protein|nr:hypothetical protein [Candidatus Nanoarchaeia archaeon]|tara:strand:+ start:7585 stop:7893 length:309 start_codon:yes stop_codon:yes gene_type:complete
MNDLKKKTIIYFVIVIVAFLVEIIVPIFFIQIIAELTYLVLGIMVIVNSIKLIKNKEYGIGIIFLVICSIILLFLLFYFIGGFIVGFQEEIEATGNAIKSVF